MDVREGRVSYMLTQHAVGNGGDREANTQGN